VLPCAINAVGKMTIDAAGAVVATDCAKTSYPDSWRRPRTRMGESSPVFRLVDSNDRPIASSRADMVGNVIDGLFLRR
jgi:hypothetical protein